MQKVISIGKQNFVSLRENDCFYIDKTDLICKWWESKGMWKMELSTFVLQTTHTIYGMIFLKDVKVPME